MLHDKFFNQSHPSRNQECPRSFFNGHSKDLEKMEYFLNYLEFENLHATSLELKQMIHNEKKYIKVILPGTSS